jgi:hypothetical protein
VILPPPFERSVFVNCPFDEDYAPILQAVAFCITDLGLHPRLAPENADNATNRLDRIVALIRGSKYAIHDLSRCKALAAGEFSRMNMPFELGVDYGSRLFGENLQKQKSILILEETRYDYQKCLSDIAGWDIHAHGLDHIAAVRHVSTWLIRQAGVQPIGPSLIQINYAAFQEWYWKTEMATGASEDDIKAYPTVKMVEAMRKWVDSGRPA